MGKLTVRGLVPGHRASWCLNGDARPAPDSPTASPWGPFLAQETGAEVLAANTEPMSMCKGGSWESGENGPASGQAAERVPTAQGRCCRSHFRAPHTPQVCLVQLQGSGATWWKSAHSAADDSWGVGSYRWAAGPPRKNNHTGQLWGQPLGNSHERLTHRAPQLAPLPSLRNVPTPLSARIVPQP